MLKKISIKKVTRVFTILLFISIMINIFLSVIKRETNLVHSDYKVLVQESAGSSNYVTYPGYDFPKRGYTLASYDCDNNATITQNTISKALSFTGPANKCTLKFDIYTAAVGQTLQKLQELSGQWQVNSGNPDFSKTSPQYKYIDGGFTGDASSSGSVRNQYYTYASSYTFNEETGTYSLVNPQVIRFNSSTNGNTLTNKYIVDPSGSSSSTAANASNLEKIYKVTAYTYILQYTISSIPSSTSSSFVCNDCGIWQTNDDYGTSYYVRGKYDNGYVKFGKNSNNQDLYWRIVRINGDESLRLIYDGTVAHTNAQSSSDRYLDATKFNTSTTDNTYLGYMYGNAAAGSYSDAHTNTNDSNIKMTLDSFYVNYLNTYSDYISDTIFCNDRSIDTKGGESSNTQLGYGTNSTQYAPRYRIYNTKTPSLVCPQKNDAFTVNDTENGNGALTYPIGLLTADEASMAGLVYGQKMPNNYLVRGKWFWTMSPSYYGSSVAGLFNVYEDGKINVNSASYEPQLVPVINLTPESVQLFTGTGTMSDPFVITEGGGTTTPTQTNIPTLTVLQNLNPNITVKSGTPDFSKAATTDEGLYQAEDDYGTSYYWRGAATTNYIKFGDWYWRIVRINGDDSLRIIYDGTSIGSKMAIDNVSYGNDTADDNALVGYMCGSVKATSYNEAHSNTNDSKVKQINDNWYINNILGSSLDNKISDTLFCNDRSVASGNAYGRNIAQYGIMNRAKSLVSLKCPQKNDRFTVSDDILGNSALTYPIGLITADEAIMAGHTFENVTTNTYLEKDNAYWTITPIGSEFNAPVYGYILLVGPSAVNYSCAPTKNNRNVVPVINIKNEAIQDMTGSGTSADPFVVH